MMPIYYVSHKLARVEIRYNPLEKHIFTLVILARKLKAVFSSPPRYRAHYYASSANHAQTQPHEKDDKVDPVIY